MLTAAVLREKKQTILRAWLDAVQSLPSAKGMPEPVLRDHVPELLDLLAETLERGCIAGDGGAHSAQAHARERHRQGFDLRQVVAEYQSLRRVLILHLCCTEPRPKIASIVLMHELIDCAVSESVSRYALENDRVRDTFVGVLGHDLRSPLSAIALNAKRIWNLKDVAPDGPVAQIASRIAASASRMERMISDLLDFTRGQLGGGIKIEREDVDLQTVVRQVVDELAVAHPTRSIQYLEARGDHRGQWDEDRLAQAISNLVANAIQHGRDPITVELSNHGEHINITVRNEGEIDPDVRRLLFDPFKRGRGAYGGGLGLGLYIVSEIARAHAGTIDVQSNDGCTTFRIALPRDEGPATSSR